MPASEPGSGGATAMLGWGVGAPRKRGAATAHGTTYLFWNGYRYRMTQDGRMLGLESSDCGRYFLSLFLGVLVQFYRGLNESLLFDEVGLNVFAKSLEHIFK